ncbi:hypothetical protein KP79_PYT09928 [Mizuhopecten yessoensis]|uniref:Uncharacterized protein n=1 Tax=Mizuhopecten yessoensis TaxID=6573 RepID=A0A210PQ82_MIZYE|nr:hypothetical protein KP79_PYT09928 [Mizuhopecten yessoensis]
MDQLDSSWDLGNADLIQQIADLDWLHNDKTDFLKEVTTLRVGYELYQRLSGERELAAMRAETIANIAKFVKGNPKATKQELQKEVAKQIWLFSQKVEKM